MLTKEDGHDPTHESRVHPTPHGGVKSTAYYRDDHGDPAPRSKATQIEIVEFDANGKQVYRTYMFKKQ